MRQRAYVEILTHGKFREHENSSLLSALYTSQVLNILTFAQLKHELIVL